MKYQEFYYKNFMQSQPEFMAMYKEFADVQSDDKFNLPRPKLKHVG